MKIKLFFVALFIVLSALPFYCQQKDENDKGGRIEFGITSPNGEVKIPFEIYRNKPRMKAVVNGINCYLTLDNGSLWDEVLFFGSSRTDSMKFKLKGETFLGDSTAANAEKADLSPGVSIEFNGITLKNQKAVITRYKKGTPNLWEGIDGQISAAFFKHFVVEFNTDSSFIKLIKPENFKVKKEWQELPMKNSVFDSRTVTAEIKMEGGSVIPIDLLIDLGGIWPVYLPIGRDERITLPANSMKSSIGMGFSGPMNGSLGRVKSVSLGKFTLNNVLTAFVDVDKNSNIFGNTMLGWPLLIRFNFFFDYQNNKIVIKPSDKFTTPFHYNMTGFECLTDRSGNLRVDKVYPGSQAAKEGIIRGDIIIKINDKEVIGLSRGELRRLLFEEGKRIKITLKNNTRSFECNLVLREIL